MPLSFEMNLQRKGLMDMVQFGRTQLLDDMSKK